MYSCCHVANAQKEINLKKWNQLAIFPLTSDNKLFREHIINVEIESYNKLKIDPNNMVSYKKAF